MHSVILWCGFLGAWLLFTGPIYQAALELDEEDAAREAMQSVQRVDMPPPPSRWWWLIPPVAYLLRRRHARTQRERVLRALSSDQMASLIGFINKATGWSLVALGALLIAVKETWELAEGLHWPLWVFFALIVVMFVLGALFTVVRLARGHRIIAHMDS